MKTNTLDPSRTTGSHGRAAPRWFTDSQIREAKAVDLLALIEQDTALKKASNGEYKGLCPFHHEESASFGVKPRTGEFYCFGCEKGGQGPINYVMIRDDCGWVDAVETLVGETAEDIGEANQDGLARRRALHHDVDQKRAREIQEARKTAYRDAILSELKRDQFQSESVIAKLAKNRPIPIEGLRIAMLTGHLRFGYWTGKQIPRARRCPEDEHEAYFVQDRQLSFAQARRLDGRMWPPKGADGAPIKADTIGSPKNVVLGWDFLADALPDDPVLLTEGTPDWLTNVGVCYHLSSRLHRQWIPLGMVAAGAAFTQKQLTRMAGRETVIFSHADDSGTGSRASNKWRDALLTAGATVALFSASDVAEALGDPRIRDLNDVFKFAPGRALNELHEILKISTPSK